MIVLLLIAVFSIILSYLLLKWFYMNYKYYSTGVYKVKGPRCYPIVGHALAVLFLTNAEILDYISNVCARFGGIVKLFIAFTPSVVITDYKLTEMILNSTTIMKKARTANVLVNWLSTGLLLSNGEKWKKRRKLITPAFHFQSLKKFVDVFHTASNDLITELSKEIEQGNSIIDIYPFISLLTLDVICETAMGTKIKAQIQRDSDYIASVKEMDRIMLLKVISIRHHFPQTYYFTKEAALEKQCLGVIHSYTDNIIKSRRGEIMMTGKKKTIKSNNGTNLERNYSFLDMLLQSTIDGQPLSDADIREEVDTFMFAGHNTTASVISFTLYSIAQYPQIQQRVLEEQKMIFSNNRDRLADYNDIMNMTYLNLVIKETLRLYPSIPMFGREVTENFEYDGMIFKKGMDLMIYPFAMHRNPKYFPDPEIFNPERFSQDNDLGMSPFAFIPFAAGSRNCIGQKFAMLEIKATVSKVVRFFELIPIPDHKLRLVPETVLKSDNGIMIEFRHRQKW